MVNLRAFRRPQVLDCALTEAERCSGSAVLIGGEAGIGKTLLVQAFSEKHADDARVLWGTCDDLSTPRTLGPFLRTSPGRWTAP